MSYDNSKISANQIRIEKLSESHLELIKTFESDSKELKDFLIEDAYKNQKMAISTTYLWFYNPENKLASYMSTLSDAIRVHGTQIGKQFVDKGVQYKTLPALKIGRMCVDKRFARRGLGTHMIHFTMKTFLQVNDKMGCRFIFLDAKPDTGAIHFYKKLGFQALKEREKGTIPMFFDMIKIIDYYKENKKKLLEMPKS